MGGGSGERDIRCFSHRGADGNTTTVGLGPPPGSGSEATVVGAGRFTRDPSSVHRDIRGGGVGGAGDSSGTVGSVGGGSAPLGPDLASSRFYFARVRTRRLSEVRKAWPDGIRDLIGGVASGISIQRALENLSRSGPAPLREAFGRFPVLARTMGVTPTLESIKEDLADPTSDRVIEVLRIAHEKGGALIPEILRDLAESTSMDLAATEEEQTEALEQRINARVVFMLPWLVLVALTFRPGPFRSFYSSPAGIVVVAIGAGLSLLGIAIVSRLSRPPDEPRVLTGAGEGRKRW